MLTLDIQEKYLLPIIEGSKTFEIREKRDRNFHVGQYVCLKHTRIESDKNCVINTMLIIKIKYITDYNQKSDHVVFSFDKIGDVMTEVEEIR
ncbi:putative RNA-binding protein [Enterococcus phage 9184]|uniref:Putative RNA-binding protein n=1 Tax=Enterococcus phage 9184 TaxID=2763103 RepID=A0A7L8ZJX6_9CAUD|nr:putative RNA-binding protein [Enterococcus phage 9184]